MLGELKKIGFPVPGSGKLSALNKQRVLVKHYGELAEPVTVNGFAQTARIAIDHLMSNVFDTQLHKVHLTQLLEQGWSKDHLEEAAVCLEKEEYYDCLVFVRKAIFLSVERDYLIEYWKNHSYNDDGGLIMKATEGRYAPIYTKNPQWVDSHVFDPTDYVQMNTERLRIQCMEWSVNLAEVENVRRLTPRAVMLKDETWYVRDDRGTSGREDDMSIASYCLDRSIAIILVKQRYLKLSRRREDSEGRTLGENYDGNPIYQKACRSSEITDTVRADHSFEINFEVVGFDGYRYFRVTGKTGEGPMFGFPPWITGYVEAI